MVFKKNKNNTFKLINLYFRFQERINDECNDFTNMCFVCVCMLSSQNNPLIFNFINFSGREN